MLLVLSPYIYRKTPYGMMEPSNGWLLYWWQYINYEWGKHSKAV